MIFSQDDLEFDFNDELGYVIIHNVNRNMIEALSDSIEDLGFDITGVDTETSGSVGIEFYVDETSDDPERLEEEIRDYFEESFRMSYEDYNSNFDWES